MSGGTPLSINHLALAVLNDLFTPVAITDRDAYIRYFNNAFRLFVNHPPRKIMRQSLFSLLENCEFGLTEQLHQASTTGLPSNGREVRGEINGQIKYFAARVIPTQDQLFIINFLDISVENQLHTKYRAKLAEIRDKTVELIHVAKMAGIGEVSAGLVHDIKNPVSTINGALSRIDKVLGDNPHPKLVRYISMCKRATNSLIRMTEQVTHFARAEPVKELHELNELVNNATILVETKIRKKAVVVRCNLPEDFPMIYVDGIQFEQVFMNLIGNACDAMSLQSNRINRIDITGEICDNRVLIHVRDNGDGMPKSVAEKIFKSFYTTKKDGKGTGLGLSIVCSIIKEHNGTIKVDSTQGEGTCFTIEVMHQMPTLRTA